MGREREKGDKHKSRLLNTYFKITLCTLLAPMFCLARLMELNIVHSLEQCKFKSIFTL